MDTMSPVAKALEMLHHMSDTRIPGAMKKQLEEIVTLLAQVLSVVFSIVAKTEVLVVASTTWKSLRI